MAHVMISLNVKSMQENATALRQFLGKYGIKCWICIDIGGGSQYREEIVSAVKSCKVFLPLMNNAWANSGECYDEYSFAKRLNLTSHEKQITKQSQQRLPIICPIAFPDLDWTIPHVELLASSTNFITCDQEKLMDERIFMQILQTIATSLKEFNVEIQLPPQLNTVSTITPVTPVAPIHQLSPDRQLFSYLENLQITLNLIKPIQSHLQQQKKAQNLDKFTFKKRYFGTLSETFNKENKPEESEKWKLTTTLWSEEFEFKDVSNPKEITGEIIWKKEQAFSTPLQADTAFKLLPNHVSNWVNKIIFGGIGDAQVEKFKGYFDEPLGMLILKGYEVSKTLACGEYHLLVTKNADEALGFSAGSSQSYKDAIRLKAF